MVHSLGFGLGKWVHGEDGRPVPALETSQAFRRWSQAAPAASWGTERPRRVPQPNGVPGTGRSLFLLEEVRLGLAKPLELESHVAEQASDRRRLGDWGCGVRRHGETGKCPERAEWGVTVRAAGGAGGRGSAEGARPARRALGLYSAGGGPSAGFGFAVQAPPDPGVSYLQMKSPDGSEVKPLLNLWKK